MLACNLVTPCFSRKPKDRVVTCRNNSSNNSAYISNIWALLRVDGEGRELVGFMGLGLVSMFVATLTMGSRLSVKSKGP